jgi:hypothetical protein
LTPLTRRQPFKTLYILSRVVLLLFLIPLWAVRYALFPRPRASWTLTECLMIRILKFMVPMNALCGLPPLAIDKKKGIPENELKETSFVWIPPVDKELVKGAASDSTGKIQPERTPGYVWPKGNGEGGPVIGDEGMVGLWIHGGGYMMGNGSEKFGETGECWFYLPGMLIITTDGSPLDRCREEAFPGKFCSLEVRCDIF